MGKYAGYRYTVVIPACKEDRAHGVSAYLVYLGVWQDPYDGHYYYNYAHGERKIGNSRYYGKSVTKHLDAKVREIIEGIIKDEFC